MPVHSMYAYPACDLCVDPGRVAGAPEDLGVRLDRWCRVWRAMEKNVELLRRACMVLKRPLRAAACCQPSVAVPKVGRTVDCLVLRQIVGQDFICTVV